MHISYARTPLPKSIFLAGPTPRSEDVPSWRPEALRLLEKHKFNGTVYVPEDSQASWAFNYDNQIEWELEALHASTVILFWIPREACMPGFTTNVEFGHFITQRNVVVGWPPTATKTKYLEGLARLHNTISWCSYSTTSEVRSLEMTSGR